MTFHLASPGSIPGASPCAAETSEGGSCAKQKTACESALHGIGLGVGGPWSPKDVGGCKMQGRLNLPWCTSAGHPASQVLLIPQGPDSVLLQGSSLSWGILGAPKEHGLQEGTFLFWFEIPVHISSGKNELNVGTSSFPSLYFHLDLNEK